MLIKAILICLLATGSQWWFSHLITRTWFYPLWSGFLVGCLMGEPVLGMQTGAYIQLAYLGWITAGGSMPGNIMVAGVYGTTLTLLSGAEPRMGVTFAAALALIGIIMNTGYMTINAFWVHQADEALNKGDFKKVKFLNFVPSFFTSLILYGLPIFLMVMFGSQWAQTAIDAIPSSLASALNVVAAIMPALGIGMLLNFIGKAKLLAFFFVGFFMSVYFGLDTMACFIFAACIAAIMYFFNKDMQESEDY
ncbi:PTS sugar transporter subunit IIC [Erysipelotrichaceae bacterium 51-3]